MSLSMAWMLSVTPDTFSAALVLTGVSPFRNPAANYLTPTDLGCCPIYITGGPSKTNSQNRIEPNNKIWPVPVCDLAMKVLV